MTPLIGLLGGAGAGAAGAGAAGGAGVAGQLQEMKGVQDLAEGASKDSKEITKNAQKGQMDALNKTTEAGTPGQVKGEQTTGPRGSGAAQATSRANADPNAPRATSG